MGVCKEVIEEFVLNMTYLVGNNALKAPEILRGDIIDPSLALKIDIFGLGMIYYHLVFG